MPNKNQKFDSMQLTLDSIFNVPADVAGAVPTFSLRDTVRGLRTVLDQTGAYIYMKDLSGRYIYANQSVQELFAATLDQIVGQEDSQFFDLAVANELSIHDRRVMDQGESIECEETNIIKPSGEKRIYWSIKKPLHNEHGQIIGLCGISTDITLRKRAEQYEHFRNYILELITGGAALSNLLTSIVYGMEELNPEIICSILLLDESGTHLAKGAAPSLPGFFNEAIDGLEIGVGVGSCGTASYTGNRVIVEDISTHPYWEPYAALAKRAGLGACWSQPIRASTGEVLGTFAIYHREPHTPSEEDLCVIEKTARLASIAIERKKTEDKIHQLAFYDPLTTLANRILLADRLDQAIVASKRSGQYGALMFLDLDNFKVLNDTHGHMVGDLLLIEVARRLKACVREVDTVARFGGDEFVIMIADLDIRKTKSTAQAQIIADKISQTLSQPYQLKSNQDENVGAMIEHRCTASIGVTLFGNHAYQKDEIFKRADKAMYDAKEAGPNLIYFA